MSAAEMFWAAPPVSRTLTAATLVISVLGHTGLVSLYYSVFWVPKLLQLPPQLWRVVTCFMITGPQIGLLFDPYFLYTYGSRLETASPKFTQPGDFMTYVLFVCGIVHVLNFFFTSAGVLLPALILAFVYTSCQDERGGSKSTFIVVTVPTQWLPFLMLIMTFVMNGQNAAISQGTGLLAAHLYDFLTRIYPTFGGGRNLISTPAVIRRAFQTTQASTQHKAYGTSFTPAQRQATGSSTGAAGGGVLPESWRNRGSGHRLGGD